MNNKPIEMIADILLDNQLAQTLQKMTVSAIAEVIKRDWKKVYFGAVPYLQAMQTMTAISDNYGADDGRSIVAYFLSNASTYRGPIAKAVKKELNARLKK